MENRRREGRGIFFYIYLEVVASVLIFVAVLKLFAIPKASSTRPRITPMIGPGNTRIEKLLAAIIAFTVTNVPLIRSRADIRTDFWPHDTPNAAAASNTPVTAKSSLKGVGGRPPKVFIKIAMVAAIASP
jgi:hypothetical protein